MEEFYKSSIEDKEPTLKEKVDELHSLLKGKSEKEIKKLKIPRKAKVRKGRMRKGWVGFLFLNENRTISAEKQKLEGGTYKNKDNNYRVTNGSELMFWEGKFPVLFQRYDKMNPTNLFPKEGDKNEVYGQDSIMLRMKRDLVKDKKKGGFNIVYIMLLLGGGYFLLKTFFPALFGG